MRLDPNPLFRRIITPWYDSTAACWMAIAAMAVVHLFGWVGLSVAWSTPEFRAHLWLPVLMTASSLLVGISLIYRLICRYFSRRFPD